MREKELKLSQQLIELQRQYNQMAEFKDEWKRKYELMRIDRDACLDRATRAQNYISERLADSETFPDI